MLIVVLLGVLIGPPLMPPAGAQTGTAGVISTDDPDALYADREQVASAERAAAIWEERLAAGSSPFESAWRLSRACYWLGGHAAAKARRNQYERGIDAGRRATMLEPNRPEGHFWMAANMGALAESYGMKAGLRYRGPIKDALETVLRIEPSFQKGSADRALGRWYHKVPGLFGGSNTKSAEHLRRSLTFDPDSTASYFFLGETLLAMDRDAEAKDAFRRVLDVPLDPNWAPEDREFKEKAQAALARLK